MNSLTVKYYLVKTRNSSRPPQMTTVPDVRARERRQKLLPSFPSLGGSKQPGKVVGLLAKRCAKPVADGHLNSYPSDAQIDLQYKYTRFGRSMSYFTRGKLYPLLHYSSHHPYIATLRQTDLIHGGRQHEPSGGTKQSPLNLKPGQHTCRHNTQYPDMRTTIPPFSITYAALPDIISLIGVHN